MKINLHNDFIVDLVNLGDANFASRVIRKVFDKSGKFLEHVKDDHRYDGIDDAWIRYVSQGKAALRIIFIKNEQVVTLYRVGPHAVEDNLSKPSSEKMASVAGGLIRQAMADTPGNRSQILQRGLASESFEDLAPIAEGRKKRLLHNHTERFLYGNLLGRRFLPHKDVYLMTPYLSFDLLRPTDLFGQMLDELIDGGAAIWLITKSPAAEKISQFEQLAARGINIFFCDDVNAKVYAFILNRDKLAPEQLEQEDFVAIGSPSLTVAGINPDGALGVNTQYELSYDIPSDDWGDVENFLLHVAALSTDLEVVRSNLIQ